MEVDVWSGTYLPCQPLQLVFPWAITLFKLAQGTSRHSKASNQLIGLASSQLRR